MILFTFRLILKKTKLKSNVGGVPISISSGQETQSTTCPWLKLIIISARGESPVNCGTFISTKTRCRQDQTPESLQKYLLYLSPQNQQVFSTVIFKFNTSLCSYFKRNNFHSLQLLLQMINFCRYYRCSN